MLSLKNWMRTIKQTKFLDVFRFILGLHILIWNIRIPFLDPSEKQHHLFGLIAIGWITMLILGSSFLYQVCKRIGKRLVHNYWANHPCAPEGMQTYHKEKLEYL